MRQGFTLIELSIVLVIIGLIVGGVLVGQDLIRAAEVRAQISQIERYNTAVNTFYGKYGALPGDMNAATASQFGFVARGTWRGTGDGNGVIEGYDGGSGSGGTYEAAGETAVFWVDLSHANLTGGSFTAASSTTLPGGDITPTSTPSLDAYFPPAKLGTGNYVYVWSGGKGVGNSQASNGTNYFGITSISGIYSSQSGYMCSGAIYCGGSLGVSVLQAYSIDKKMDDGYPLTGTVTAQYVTYSVAPIWAGVDRLNDPATIAIAPSSSTCFDNGNVSGALEQYSMSQNGGAGVNCALSFRFQ